MVEFVGVLGLLMTFLLLMIAAGQSLWYHQVVTEGVRDGVRYLARMPLDATSIDNAKKVALTGSPDGSQPARAFWTDPGTVTVQTTAISHGGTLNGPDPLIVIRMTASVPVGMPVLTFFGLGPTITLTATDEARHIGD